jgi:hypothetical protein
MSKFNLKRVNDTDSYSQSYLEIFKNIFSLFFVSYVMK